MGTAEIAPPPGFVEDSPPPPPGFVLDDPPLPEGFVEEVPAPTDSADVAVVPDGLTEDAEGFRSGVQVPITPYKGTVVKTTDQYIPSLRRVPMISRPLDPVADAALREREKEMGIPPFSLGPEGIQDAIGEHLAAQSRTPFVNIPRPDNTGVGTGIARGLIGAIEGLETPENLGLLGGMSGASKGIQQLMSAGFGGLMVTNALDQFEAASKAGTPGERAEGYTNAVISLLIGGAAAKHAAGRAPISAAERGASMDVARATVDASKSVAEIPLAEPVVVERAPAAGEALTEPATRTPAPAGEAARSTPIEIRPQEAAPEIRDSLAETTKAETAESTYAGGPGAMGPVEAAEMAAANRVTGTKNERMRLEREARGEEEVIKEQPVTNRESIDRARDELAANPNRGEEIVERLRTSTQDVRSISTAEEAVLMAHKVELMKQRTEQEAIYGDGNRTPEELAIAAQRIGEIEQKMNAVDQATYASGAEWGRMGQLRQRLLREDYSFEQMERRARIQKGDALTPEESVKIKEQAARISDLEKQLEGATKQAGEKAGEAAADEAFKATKARADAENRKSGKASIPKERESLASAIDKRAKDGDTPNDVRSFVQRLALNLVRSGVLEREPLIDGVHQILKQSFPKIERSQTRDLISGYGDVKLLDKEAAKVTLRGLKGEMQQVGKIEDMQAKIAPKKTGMERRSMTDEERRLLKEVNELKKKGGFNVTDPATQLKTAKEAIKTRLQNEIRDLDAAIATKEPLPKKTGGVEYDAEMKALRDQRDAKRAEYDEAFPKEPLSDEQVIAQMSKSLDRSIADLEASLKEGRLYPDKTSRKLTSPENEAKRARLEALRAERQTLRDLDTASVESAKEAKLLKAIEQAQKAVPEPKEGAPTVETQRVAELKRVLQEARDARSSSPESMNRKIQQATEVVRKQIAELDRKIREGDVAPSEGKDALRSNELDALRNERDALEAYLREERNRLKPRKSAEEIALQSYKTRTATRIADLQERIAAGDYAPAPKHEITLDKEALDLRVKIEQIKEQYNEGVLKMKLAQRSIPRKIIDTTAEVLNTARAILTSVDFSAVGRQGGFIGLGNPVRAARAIPDMFKAFVSEAAQKRSAEQIKARSNHDLYDKSKLYLSDLGTNSLSRMEEAYMSRWAKNIPVVAGSERAYITFLNRVRADTFDALVNSLGGPRGVSLDEAKVIASFVNAATGRGKLPGKLDASAGGLATVFFSPRYVASRFQLMAGEPMYAGTARTRAVIAKEYAKFLTGVGVVYAMAQLAGADVETDPRSSDFGKLKFGNTRIDPLGGILQNTVLLSRVTTGEKKDAGGKIVTMRGDSVPYKGETLDETLARFTRTKFSPLIGSAVDLAAGKNVIGQEVSPGGVALNMVIPMSLRDVYDTMIEQGVPRGTAITLVNMFGFGAQTYDETKARAK